MLIHCTALFFLYAFTICRTARATSDNTNVENLHGPKIVSDTKLEERHLMHRQKKSRKYSHLDAQSIYIALNALARTYPELATLKSAQDVYGLPGAGEQGDCPYDRGIGCKNWMLTIEDKITHPDGSESNKRLPEVALFGAIHGDERVGPVIVVEVASLLLEAAYCEALPRGVEPASEADPSEWTAWEEELRRARECRADLKNNGVDETNRKWLARLVTTRRIVLVPTPNALGYFQNERNENGLSTKSDFPFDITDPTKCMQTISGRTINELFREHMFQLAISFHSGYSAIGYEWSSPSYKDKSSPDDEAQDKIAAGLAEYAGKFEDDKVYRTGTLTEMFYPVRGRLEDWAYAGSWDTELVRQCEPNSYGGYPEEKTVYNDSVLRAITVMIKTSEELKGKQSTLGSTWNLFEPKSTGTGHVPRGIRMSLMSIDIVEPYIDITAVDGLELPDRVVPLRPTVSRSCMTTKTFSIPEGKQSLNIEWYVGGAISVGSTSVFFAKWSDLPDDFDGVSQPSKEVKSAFIGEVDGDIGDLLHVVPGGRGKARWYKADPDLDRPYVTGPTFSASIDTSAYKRGDVVAVFAVAHVDKSWEKRAMDASHPIAPQSHLVNARRNPDWYCENAGKIIEGRLEWFSVPVTLNFGPGEGVTMEVSERLAPDAGLSTVEKAAMDTFAVFGFLSVCAIAWSVYYGRKKRAENVGKPSRRQYSTVERESNPSQNQELEQYSVEEESNRTQKQELELL